MTDQEVKIRLEMARHVMKGAMEHFIGEPATPEAMAAMKKAVLLALTRADMSGVRPYITDLVDVVVECDPDDPSMMVVGFKRKVKV